MPRAGAHSPSAAPTDLSPSSPVAGCLPRDCSNFQGPGLLPHLQARHLLHPNTLRTIETMVEKGGKIVNLTLFALRGRGDFVIVIKESVANWSGLRRINWPAAPRQNTLLVDLAEEAYED